MTIQTKIPMPEQAEFVSPVPAATSSQPKRKRSRALLVGASLATLSGLGWFGWDYWTVGRFEVSTDDAYVKADSTTAAPKVSGYLDAVAVEDNQQVKTGQILAHIDDRDFKAALDQARANVAASQANVDRQKAALETQQSIIEAARAAVEVDVANQAFAHQDDKRYAILAADGFGSVQNSQQASSRVAALRATIAHDNAALATAIKQVDQIKAELAQAEAALARDQANQRQAELNLGYTTINAPFDGTVGARTVQVGQYVQPGTQLLAVVPLHAVYITANYMETQLTNVRAGQNVTIDVDTFPGTVVHGRVASLSPASGQQFALLPPDNATGNFTKIVQRIPVRIDIDPHDALAGLLRPGMSVEPSIDTRAH